MPLHLSQSDLEYLEKGKDEMNLAEFPIAVVAESAKPGQLTLEFSDSIMDRSTGLPLERRDMMKRVEQSKDRHRFTVPMWEVEKAIEKRETIKAEQADVVRHVTQAKDGIVVVTGDAGTGKTFALDAVREAGFLS